MKKRAERPDLPARFFKVIVPSTDSLRRLRIPLPFTRKYGHELSDVVRLYDNTAGDVWCVGLKKVEDKLFLHDGWQKFVGDHFITYGYFLVFKYLGNSTFNVHIFDLSATEVHYPLNGNCNVGRTNLGSRDTISTKDEDRDDDDSVMGSKYKKPSSGTRSRPRKKTLDFAGKSPSFTVKLKATNLYPRNSIYIPIAFCEYMPSAREQVELLDSDGRKWPVSITRGKGKEKYLKGGWSQFARQKKLRVGDVCIFELIDTNKHVLKVSTFGIWQQEKSLPHLTATATSTSTSTELCHPSDKAALLAFKHSFSNPNPLPTWDPNFDCCNYYGVTCNETTNFVTELDIGSDYLTGEIPTALANLTHLEVLRLHKIPNLIGEIPPAIGKITKLRFLEISWTNISGQVPHFLVNLKNLVFLELPFNSLSGPIPPSLATLPYLRVIDLSRNQLTGPIPESFGHLPKTAEVPALDLSHNKLSGEIPMSLGNLNFSSVDISRNNLSGDASVFFGKGKITTVIAISRNNFEFDFSKVSFMDSLVVLDISHNKIYGSIPQQITEDTMLQRLNVTYNRLCGKIPTGWKLRFNPEGWDSTSFFHNKCLCGAPLDPCK